MNAPLRVPARTVVQPLLPFAARSAARAWVQALTPGMCPVDVDRYGDLLARDVANALVLAGWLPCRFEEIDVPDGP